jgi:hypothetical protein
LRAFGPLLLRELGVDPKQLSRLIGHIEPEEDLRQANADPVGDCDHALDARFPAFQ